MQTAAEEKSYLSFSSKTMDLVERFCSSTGWLTPISMSSEVALGSSLASAYSQLLFAYDKCVPDRSLNIQFCFFIFILLFLFVFEPALNPLLLRTPRSDDTNQALIVTVVSIDRKHSRAACDRPCTEQQSTHLVQQYARVTQTAGCDNASQQTRTSVLQRAPMYMYMYRVFLVSPFPL